ncbi:MAG: hypothetical protein R3A47_09775 [Polyangiales bacterium]
MTRWSVVFVVAVLSASCTCSKGGPPPPPITRPSGVLLKAGALSEQNNRSAVGLNLAQVADWSTEHPFVDVFKTSRDWVSAHDGVWSDETPIDIDEHGWVRSLKPGQVVKALALWETKHYPKGKYIVLYDGEGTIEYDEGPASNRFLPDESRPGRHVVELDPARSENGMLLVLRSTNPSNYIRNIRVLLPGGVCENDFSRSCGDDSACGANRCKSFESVYATEPFNPVFLSRVRKFSALRFMDWMATNNSAIAEWKDRPKLDDARWTLRGVPLEMMIALSNRLSAEPWFTIPHRANDEYVRNFAAKVRADLDQGLRAWVEFSNEVWNPGFSQSREVAESCAGGRSAGDPYRGALVCYAERAIAIFEIWNKAFGAQSDRVVRVLASQAASSWASDQILDHQEVFKRADVLAIAPYFGVTADPENSARIASMNVDALLKFTETDGLANAIKFIEEQATIAKKRGLKLVAYEGGPAFDAVPGSENHDKINALFDAINRDPGWRCALGFLQWKTSGGGVFLHFEIVANRFQNGSAGGCSNTSINLQAMAKYRQVVNVETNPRWW